MKMGQYIIPPNFWSLNVCDIPNVTRSISVHLSPIHDSTLISNNIALALIYGFAFRCFHGFSSSRSPLENLLMGNIAPSPVVFLHGIHGIHWHPMASIGIPCPDIFLSLFQLLVVLIEVLFVLRNHCLFREEQPKIKVIHGDTMSPLSGLRMSMSVEGSKQNIRMGIHKRKFSQQCSTCGSSAL